MNNIFIKYFLNFWGICSAVSYILPDFAAFLTNYTPVWDFLIHLRKWVPCSLIIYTSEMQLYIVTSIPWYSKYYTVFLNGIKFIFVLMFLLFEACFLKWLELLMLINSYIYILCNSICSCVVNSCKQLRVVNKDK